MRPPEPVTALDLFPEERAELLGLLAGLRPDQWALPTVCPGWSVKDIALHLLGDDLGRLSRGRDRFSSPAPREETESLVELVNQLNELWVASARRLSPQVLCDLLRVTGESTLEYFRTLDLEALGEPVSWAGPEAAPVWLDVAREYTERWHHQQQIRDAVGAPGLLEPRLFAPVLATFVHAFPHTLRCVDAADGSTVHLRITGEAGGDWSILHDRGRWHLYTGAPDSPSAQVTIDQAVAWRLFTKGISPEDAERVSISYGDDRLARRVFQMVSVIA